MILLRLIVYSTASRMASKDSGPSEECRENVAASNNNKRSLGLDDTNGWDGRGYPPTSAAPTAADPKRYRRDHAGDDDFDDADVGDYQRSQRKDGETYDYGHSEQSSRDRKYSQEYHDDGGYDHQKDEVEVDEFGRQRAPPNFTRKVPDEWPPRFETHGSTYVFDTRCAMFYQSDSGFFYDPKTKLYYGNKQGAYFRYDESKKPPFEKVQNAVPGTETEKALNPLDPILLSKSASRSGKDSGKKMISIKIKSKTLVSTKPKKETPAADIKQAAVSPAAGAPSRVQKQYGAAMDKWSERQTEKKVEVKQQHQSEKVKVAKTIKGEPICLLCKRKFPTMEKLQYHEKASALHQENLAKQALLKTASFDPSAADYVDRAQQRRDMHGMESSTNVLPLTAPAALLHASPAGPPPAIHPSENLGQTNIGNQMLQKLGWKSGDLLGRQGGDANQNVIQNAIIKDWEKIEAIASKGQHTSARRHRR